MSEPRKDGRTDAGADDERLCVGVVLDHGRNRALLTEWLDASYDVLAPEADGVTFEALAERADLLLLDERAYERIADRVAAYRNREVSLFSPVLLLASSDDARGSVDAWADVDDVVSTPVEKAVLHARIDGLLSRRRLSRELAASEDRFRTLFETSPDPTVVLDDSDRVVDSNAAFRDLVGVAGDCRGRSLPDFDAFPSGSVEAMCGTGDGDEPGGSSVVPVQTATERRYVECDANDLATTPDHRILILRDVTERVHHEEELQRQVDRLDEFAGVLAHEIRNPLGIASGWLDQAERTGDPEAFDRVETAHERMDGLIGDLLELARQGSVVGERTSVPLAELVTDSWGNVTTGDATLDVDSSLAGRTVTGDPDRIREVFENLFRNAVEHGGPEVSVEAGVTEDGRGVYVEDDGVGLSATDREQLFESGYTTAEHGTGFGLAIVEQIAEAHGWTVAATDAAGGGARFELHGVLDGDAPTVEPA